MTESSTAPCRIAFVRHGTVKNPKNVFYGRLPGFGLSEKGRRQAQAAADALRAQPVTAIYASPQRRAFETAAAIQAAHPALPVHESPYLNEIYTPFDGQPRPVLAARGWDLYTGTADEYEQPAAVLARGQAFLAQARARHPGGYVVAVTHGDLIAFLILWTQGRPLTQDEKSALDRFGIAEGYPAPASITTLTFSTGRPDEIPTLAYTVPHGRRSRQDGPN